MRIQKAVPRKNQNSPCSSKQELTTRSRCKGCTYIYTSYYFLSFAWKTECITLDGAEMEENNTYDQP